MLTVFTMLNKFSYSHERTFNRRNQNYDWKSSILCPQSKISRTATFSFKIEDFETVTKLWQKKSVWKHLSKYVSNQHFFFQILNSISNMYS